MFSLGRGEEGNINCIGVRMHVGKAGEKKRR